MKAIAVIGMNYGDEGKGHITNFLSDKNTLNVRFNGGAQAAHSVCLSNGRNHIFHHFGSGTLKNTRTLLANRFICNPIFFAEEYEQLIKKTTMQKIFIDPRCLVTTHYDMIINAFKSHHENAHNTTGLGINETIERSRFRQLRLNIRRCVDLSEDELKRLCKKIEFEYMPWRCDELKLPSNKFNQYYNERVKQPNKTLQNYVNTIKFMLKNSVIWPDDNLIERYLEKEPGRKIVFEGAQGLLLDQQKKEYMPFLTRSNTGLKNVFEILKTVRTPIELQTCLVTRSYLTRHGDGPLFNELFHGKQYEKLKDPNNPINEFQGKLRFGTLNNDWYNQALKEIDRQTIKNDAYPAIVAMTCLDQINHNTNNLKRIKLVSHGSNEKDISWTKNKNS